jgi:hypothetical protein
MATIVIAMPCAQAAVKMQATQSSVDAAVALGRAGFDVRFAAVEFAEVVMARNYLASWALNEGADKLFFIDSDMHFPASVPLQLLAAEKDVIGVIYPTRQVAMERVVELARTQPDASAADVFGAALNYNVRQASQTFHFEDGITEVDGIGMGVTLIDAGVLRALIEKGAAPLLPIKGMGDFPLYGFFDLVQEGGVPLSEDLSFCARWRGVRGKVHAIDGSRVGHVGHFTYRGSFVKKLGG